MTMTINEMIEVLQGCKEGKEIECSAKYSDDWFKAPKPCWNFDHYKYRIKKNPTNLEVANQLVDKANKMFEDAFGVNDYYVPVNVNNCPMPYFRGECPFVNCDDCMEWWNEEYKGK